tara:strand:+ start:4598 stop:5365 length:768 start_codon:yes stop_codon:yes gene_type:complete
MKHLSPNTILLVLLGFTISTIYCVEFVFDDVPELFSGGEKLGSIVVNICLSFIAAYIFYLVTYLIPKHIERKHIEEHAAHLINKVLFYILFIVQDAANFNIPQKDLKLKDLSEDDFKNAMTNLFMDNEIRNFRAGIDGHNVKVGQAVINSMEGLTKTVNELFKYSQYIETQLIADVSSATRNNMIESWTNRYRMTPIHFGGQILAAARTDVSCYAEYVHEYHRLYRSIETIFLTKYASTEAAKKYAENIANLRTS